MLRPDTLSAVPTEAQPARFSVRLRLIGQMEAWTPAGDSVLPPGRKTRALLAIVALSQPRPILRARLAELLWSRRPEEQARASLRQEIHRLLEVLSPSGQDMLIINRDSLAVRPGSVWLDVEEVLRATVENPGSLTLFDSELLEELDGIDPAFDAWLHAERERLRDRARSVAEALLTEARAPETLIPVAQQLLTIDKAHEGAWRALMRAHADRGERGMAIQSYDRCRAVLADLIDAVPSPETQALLAEIRGGKTVRQPPAPPPAPKVEKPAPMRGGAKLGVLPLILMGTDESESHLASGLAEEITSALARFRWLFLVSTSSVQQAMAEGRDDAALRRHLGLDYLLDGSVQRSGRRLRVTMRLIDLQDGSQIVWARRFDRTAEDLLTVQEEVASEIVAQVEPEIILIESRRAARRTPDNGSAYELVMRAIPAMIRLDRPAFLAAGDLLRRAVELDPEYAAAHARLALWYCFLVQNGWSDDPEAAGAEAGEHAGRAITLDPQDAKGFAISGHVRGFLQHRLQESLALHERSIQLNPNLAMAWAMSGLTLLGLGQVEEAERRLQRYKQLSPMDPGAFLYDSGFCLVALMRRDYEAAVVAGRAAHELNPGFAGSAKPYLSALGHLGQEAEAASVRRRLLCVDPAFTVASYRAAALIEDEAERDHLAEGLRLAGVPEA